LKAFLANRPHVIALSLLAVTTLIVHWRWFLPGVITDQDWYLFSTTHLRELFPSQSMVTLSSGLGDDNRDSINYYPVITLLALLARIGFSPEIAVRSAVMFPTILLLVFGGYAFARTYVRDALTAVFAGLLYAFNAYINVIVGRGQMTVAESVAWSALALAACVRAIRPGARIADALVAALCLALAFVCDVRIALLACAAALLLCAVELRGPAVLPQLGRGAIVAGAMLGLLLYVIVPTIASRLTFQPPSDYGDVSWLPRLSFTSMAQAITLDHPLWYDNVIHPWRWKFAVYLVPTIAGLWMLFKDREQRLRAAAFIVLISAGAVLLTGAYTNFGVVYAWLFTHTWFFHLFRDPSKFTALMLPGYSLAFGIGASSVARAFTARWTRSLAAVTFALLALYPAKPILIGAETQLYWPKHLSDDEVRFAHSLESDPVPSRVLWVPIPDRFVPADDMHPRLDALWLSMVSVRGASSLADAGRLAEALSACGVGYVVVLRNESEALRYPPASIAFRTLRAYAALGLFGTPVQDGPVLTVYKIFGGGMLFADDPKIAQLRIGGAALPVERRIPPAAPSLVGPIIPERGWVRIGSMGVKLPVDFRDARDWSLVRTAPPPGTLMAPLGGLRVTGLLPEQATETSWNADSVFASVPDWNAYVDLGIRVEGAGVRGAAIAIETPWEIHGYQIAGIRRAGSYHVLLQGENLPRRVSIRGAAFPAGRIGIESVRFVSGDYAGFVDTALLATARPALRAAVVVPLAAARSVRSTTALRALLTVRSIREFPATLEPGGVTLLENGATTSTLAAPVRALPFWAFEYSTSVGRASEHAARVGDFVGAAFPTEARDVSFVYVIDRQLGAGELASLFVLVALLALIAFDRGRRHAAG